MNIQAFISSLTAKGIFLFLVGDKLLTSPRTNPQGLALTIRCERAALIAHLRHTSPSSDLLQDPAPHLARLLAAGRLGGFGERRTAMIASKIAQEDTAWLAQLARSKDLGRVLGVAA